jgi:hypothetical protein
MCDTVQSIIFSNFLGGKERQKYKIVTSKPIKLSVMRQQLQSTINAHMSRLQDRHSALSLIALTGC